MNEEVTAIKNMNVRKRRDGSKANSAISTGSTRGIAKMSNEATIFRHQKVLWDFLRRRLTIGLMSSVLAILLFLSLTFFPTYFVVWYASTRFRMAMITHKT